MTELTLIKRIDGSLAPATHQDAEKVAKLKVGQGLRGEWKRRRNVGFHRKYFALLNIGFDAFEPTEQAYRGMPVQKNFDRFRKDVICAAGFYDVVANLNGDVRAEARSISFAKMDQDEFEQLYSKTADVLLQRVLRTYTRADLDQQVEQILGMC